MDFELSVANQKSKKSKAHDEMAQLAKEIEALIYNNNIF
jgi:hypothetical protein